MLSLWAFKALPFFFCAYEIIDLYILLARIYDLWNGFMSTYKVSDLYAAETRMRPDEYCYVEALGS